MWLATTMQQRGWSQAQLARSVGVADTQVSRWRRGQVVPTLAYLQRLADTFGVERAALDRLVGLPVAEARPGGEPSEPATEAELQAHLARLREVLQERLPRPMWRSYVEACVALADGLSASARGVLRESAEPAAPPMGFRSHPNASQGPSGPAQEDATP
jgi:transcriptional regulator with XRE-family HTH domain